MRLSARRIEREGATQGMVLVAIEDRTDVERYAQQARQHLAELTQADRSKTIFLSMLAHELRNPLAPMRNSLDIMGQSGVSPEMAHQMRAMMGRQVVQLARLVDDLLDLARINQGRVDVRKQCVDVALLVQEAAEAARLSIEAKSIEFVTLIAHGPVFVDADSTRLTQAVGNLLHNASKFTDPGGRIAIALEREKKAGAHSNQRHGHWSCARKVVRSVRYVRASRWFGRALTRRPRPGVDARQAPG